MAVAVLYDLLADVEAHTNSFLIKMHGTINFSEHGKYRVHFIFSDSLAFVDYVNKNAFLLIAIGYLNAYIFPRRELESILC